MVDLFIYFQNLNEVSSPHNKETHLPLLHWKSPGYSWGTRK